MPETRATVTCPECGIEETFTKLESARSHLETHRVETGHDPVWEIHRLSAGVEQAGDDAGVCGRPECGASETPLVPTRPSDR